MRDRFALLFPPEGEYEILVGIYDPTGGLRYRVTAPEEGAWHIIVVKRYAPQD
ncbi:MAG: hypothetical protein SXV54_00735 [Chloroflexota bacterium]|nr:hypothetical protein [Chloroflexota bacterium]